MVYESYNRLNDCSSQLGLLVEGVDSKYSKLDKEITDSTTNKTIKFVKAIYSPNRGAQVLAIGNEMFADNFKHATLTSKGQTLINGRSLVTMAKSKVDYMEKAMTHASSFLDSNKQLPSGNFINNLLDYILDEMWEGNLAASKSKKKSKLPEMDRDSKIQRKEKPKDWTSFGYLAFCMFPCPLLTQPNDRLDSFLSSRWKEGQYYVTERMSKEDEKR